MTSVVKAVLLNDIAEANIKQEILGDASLEAQSVQEVVTLVEAKEAARDAVTWGRTSQAAALSTYKNNAISKPPTNTPSNASSTTEPAHLPKEKKCRSGNAYFDYAEWANSG